MLEKKNFNSVTARNQRDQAIEGKFLIDRAVCYGPRTTVGSIIYQPFQEEQLLVEPSLQVTGQYELYQ